MTFQLLTDNSTLIARVISLWRASILTLLQKTVQRGVLVELIMLHFGRLGATVLVVVVVVLSVVVLCVVVVVIDIVVLSVVVGSSIAGDVSCSDTSWWLPATSGSIIPSKLVTTSKMVKVSCQTSIAFCVLVVSFPRVLCRRKWKTLLQRVLDSKLWFFQSQF